MKLYNIFLAFIETIFKVNNYYFNPLVYIRFISLIGHSSVNSKFLKYRLSIKEFNILILKAVV